MSESAELRAATRERPASLRKEQDSGVVAGDQIALAEQAGYPEAVDHVARFAVDLHGPIDGKVQLVRGDRLLARRSSEVADLPPPLVGHELQAQRPLRLE